MAHNALVRSPVTNWSPGSQILTSEFVSLDLNLGQSINGKTGGCWAPQNQIVLTGQSLGLTGPAVVCYGGTMRGTAVGGFTFQGQGLWPQYGAGHVGATQQRLYPLSSGYALNDPSVDSIFYQQTGTASNLPIYQLTMPWPQSPFWRQRFTDCGIQVLAPFMSFPDGLGFRPMQWRSPLRVYDGATLSSVTVCWRVKTAPQQVPLSMPLVRVVSVDPFGNTLPLTSTASGADANGWVSLPKPSTPAAWYNLGQAQRMSITCDQNNVMSVQGFTYALEISEAAPALGYPWQLTCKAPVFAAIFSLGTNLNGTATIDGVSVGNFGERVLVAGGVSPTNWAASSQFSQGSLTQATVSATVYQFRCIQAGTTGATTPTWSAGFNAVVQDGTVFWRNIGVYNAGNFITDPVGNGIWIASTGNWQRAPDMTLPSDFSQGMLVPIAECANGGAKNGAMGSAIVQASSNFATWDPTATPLQFVTRGSDEDETTAVSGTEMFAHGLVWHSVAAVFTGITQQAFD